MEAIASVPLPESTNGLGALEISPLFCYSLTCYGFGALSSPFKIALLVVLIHKRHGKNHCKFYWQDVTLMLNCVTTGFYG